MPVVTDPRDVRTLIPRTRRAVDGPAANSPAAPTATLTDDQIKDLVADAIADVILYTGGLFGHTLEVTARDGFYQAPAEYATDSEMTLPEGTVIVCQAALTFFFHKLRDLKVSETIRDEGQEWSYSISANVLRDQIAQLQSARDKALEVIEIEEGEVLEQYSSFLAVRDSAVSSVIEPWVDEGGLGTSLDTRVGF